MPSFGIIQLNEVAECEYLTELAKRANEFGFECYRFTPKNIDPISQIVTGYKFIHSEKEWVQVQFDIPTILYDRCFYSNDKEAKEYSPIIHWLKSRKDLIFLSHGFPNKWDVYQCLKLSPSLSPYLPETKKVLSFDDIRPYFINKESFLMKPLFSSQGRGIYVIEPSKDSVSIKTVKQGNLIHKILSFHQAKKWIIQLIKKYSYLIQPYLSLNNHDSRPFDIRVFLQKDENGNWIERGKCVRIGPFGSFLSNISAGGEIKCFEDGLNKIRHEYRRFIEQEINEIVRTIPIILEEKYTRLFELGIDIGIDEKGAIWLLEVNSKPGRKSILETAPDLKNTLFQAPFLYAKYLLNNKLVEKVRE